MPRAAGPFDAVRAAGKKFVGHDESAEACLRDLPDPPSIHATTLKFTERSAPGQRLPHPGQREGPPRAGATYGRVSSSSAETTSALLDASLPPMAAMIVRKSEEATFLSTKRLPLGKSYVHGGEVARPPAATLAPGFRYGLPGASVTESAKEYIQGQAPADPEGDEAAERVYQKSHRAFAPGVQRRGAVDWRVAGVDPEAAVFGMPAASKERAAVEKCINPTVEGGAPDAALTYIIPKRTDDFWVRRRARPPPPHTQTHGLHCPCPPFAHPTPPPTHAHATRVTCRPPSPSGWARRAAAPRRTLPRTPPCTARRRSARSPGSGAWATASGATPPRRRPRPTRTLAAPPPLATATRGLRTPRAALGCPACAQTWRRAR